MVIDEKLKQWLRVHEGFNHLPYIDSVGKLTIGYGRNIQDNGISRAEAEFMFNNDILRAIQSIEDFSWYQEAPESTKRALVNMMFNLGLPRFLSFKRMIEALKRHDYTQAAIEALDSKWAAQVGSRAKDVALMIRQAQ